MKAKRKYLTPKERAAMREAQHDMCVCGCDQPLGERTVAEHWICVALGNGEKPDSLLRYECALEKTKRDVKAIAKVKRIRRGAEGKRRPKRKIPARPFPTKEQRRVQKLWADQRRADRETGAAQ